MFFLSYIPLQPNNPNLIFKIVSFSSHFFVTISPIFFSPICFSFQKRLSEVCTQYQRRENQSNQKIKGKKMKKKKKQAWGQVHEVLKILRRSEKWCDFEVW